MVDLKDIWAHGFDPLKVKEKPSSYGSADPEGDFRQHMANAGYKPPLEFLKGQITRMADPSDTGKKESGWFVYYEIENEGADSVFGTGVFGSWKDGSKHQWSSKQYQYMTTFEREQTSLRQREAQEKAQKEREKSQVAAAKRANNRWDKAKPDRS